MKGATQNVDAAANEAIYHNQLPTHQAIRFVTRQARVPRKEAISAIENALIGYKKKENA